MFIPDFWLGLIAGFSLAGVIGVLFQQIRLSQKKVDSFFEPQKVTMKTEKTPAGVFAGCLSGWLTYLFWILLIVLVLYLLREYG